MLSCKDVSGQAQHVTGCTEICFPPQKRSPPKHVLLYNGLLQIRPVVQWNKRRVYVLYKEPHEQKLNRPEQ